MSKQTPQLDRDPANAQRIAEAAGKAMYARDHAVQALGIALLEIGPGRARVGMTVSAEMVNGHATCHGGLIFTLADTAFAYACNAYNENNVAQYCTISYLAPARQGDRLTAVAEETARSGRNGVYDVRVTDQKGDVIALFRGNSRAIPGKVVADPMEMS
jgi:acyl-CoA thioesterase